MPPRHRDPRGAKGGRDDQQGSDGSGAGTGARWLRQCPADVRRAGAGSLHRQLLRLGTFLGYVPREGWVAAMTSKPVALLLADLVATKTHARPHVSNDDPFSEAQFKTLKYRPAFPARFGSIQDARAHCHIFFPWYKTELPSLRSRSADARRCALWRGRAAHRGASDRARHCLCGAPGTLPSRPAPSSDRGNSEARGSSRRCP